MDREYLIIGAGPAGLQLGYFLEQRQRDYLILERSQKPVTRRIQMTTGTSGCSW